MIWFVAPESIIKGVLCDLVVLSVCVVLTKKMKEVPNISERDLC